MLAQIKIDTKCHSEAKGRRISRLILRSFATLRMTAVLALFTICYLLFAIPTHAQTSTPSSTLQLPTYIPPTSPLYTDLLVSNLFHTFSCLAIGSSVIGQPCLTYQISKNAQGAIQGMPVLSQANLSGGVLGTTGNLIGALYMNPPVRTVDYLASVGQGLGIVKEARAQFDKSSGANVLSPILTLWQISRNIAYVVMIIIFVIIGLMIMFRQRINPQTVITAQAALPGLVLGLILITFSYFFAALVSDTAFIGTNLVGFYFSQVRGDPQPQNLVQEMDNQHENVLSIFSRYAGIIDPGNAKAAVFSIWDKLGGDVQLKLRLAATAIVAQFAMPFGGLGGGVGQLIVGTVSAFITNLSPDGIVGLVLSIMATFILIYAMLRLLLRLINNYLTIIFLTITAPFQFLAASLPGRQGIATGWILNMLSNALAFPAVLAVLYFVAFILGKSSGPLRISDTGAVIGNGFISAVSAQGSVNIIETATFPLFGGMSLDFVRLLLAFGALTSLPAIPDIIARTIGRVGVAGQLLGEEYGRGVAGGRGYASQASGAGPGFAERVGNLRDQPFREATYDEVTGKTTWTELKSTKAGIGSPTMGTWSRIKASSGWQSTLGRWIK